MYANNTTLYGNTDNYVSFESDVSADYVQPCIKGAVISVEQYSDDKHLEGFDTDSASVHRWLNSDIVY